MNNFQRAPARGEIYYIRKACEEGFEPQTGRPAIVVSNDMCNRFSNSIEVVYLTAQPKKDLPTHVTIRSSTKPSVALCEQINTIDKSRLGDYIEECTEEEMESINNALMISLGIDTFGDAEPREKIVEVVKEVVKEVPVEVIKEVPVEVVKEAPILPVDSAEFIAVKAQLDMMQTMYNNLLASVMVANKNQ